MIELGFSFVGPFYVVVYFITDACLLCCVFYNFSALSKDWLGRTSLK